MEVGQERFVFVGSVSSDSPTGPHSSRVPDESTSSIATGREPGCRRSPTVSARSHRDPESILSYNKSYSGLSGKGFRCTFIIIYLNIWWIMGISFFFKELTLTICSTNRMGRFQFMNQDKIRKAEKRVIYRLRLWYPQKVFIHKSSEAGTYSFLWYFDKSSKM